MSIMEKGAHLVALLYASLCIFSFEVKGQTYENASSLKTVLLTNYDPWLVPKNNQSDIMIISPSMKIYALMDIDAVGGFISTLVSLEVTWTDERMIWVPSDYNGVKQIKFSQESVWTPKMGVSRSVDTKDVGDKWVSVTYRSDGRANWNPAFTVKTACAFNVRYWPFDKQICYVSFFLFDKVNGELLLKTDDRAIDMTYFFANAEWDVEETFTFNMVYQFSSEVKFGLKLKRQASFYVLTVIVPLVALSLMNCLAFLIPSESGERIGYTVTIMLSIFVFFLLIGEHMPKTSDPLPIICLYLVINVGLDILCLFATILSMAFYYREGNVPAKSWSFAIVHLVKHGHSQTKSLDVEPQDGSTDGNKKKHAHRASSFLATGHEEDVIAWKEAGRALDKVFFVVFLVATTATSIGLPLYLATMSTYPALYK